MVAPTGVNEEAPRDPATVEPPGPVAAGLEQAEEVAEDPAADLKKPVRGARKPARRAKKPAVNLGAAASGKDEPAGSVVTEPVPAETVPAQAEPVEANLAEAGPAEPLEAPPEPTRPVAVEPERAQAEPAEPVAAEPGPAKAEPAEPVAAEAGPAEPAEAEPVAAAEAVAAEAESQPVEPKTAEAGQPEVAAGPVSRVGEAQEAADVQEGSRDVGPLAVVGIVVGVIVLVGVAAGVLAMVTHGFKPKTVVTYRPAAVYGLRPGQCVNAGSNSLSFTMVSCASPHDAEVFARYSLPAAAWPGSSAVRQEAGDGCASRLSGYLNPQLASIGLTQEYVYPNRDAWEAGQRTVVCEVSSGNGRLTGSVRAKS